MILLADFFCCWRLLIESAFTFMTFTCHRPLNKNMIKHQFTSTICKRISVSTENYIRHKNPFQARFPWHLKWSNETVPFKIDRSYTRAYVGRDSLKIFFFRDRHKHFAIELDEFYFRFARVFQHDINCQLRWKENVREKLIIKKKLLVHVLNFDYFIWSPALRWIEFHMVRNLELNMFYFLNTVAGK